MAVFRNRRPHIAKLVFVFSRPQLVTMQVRAVVQNAAGVVTEAFASFVVIPAGPPVIGIESGQGNATAVGHMTKAATGHAVGTSTAIARRGGRPVGVLLTITKG